MNDEKLETAFSIYIRVRDADDDGYCRCFTCSHVAYWNKMDCGHGISRSRKGVKYDEKNNHPQCKSCNRHRDGMQAVYQRRVEQVYGAGSWETLLTEARKVIRWTQSDIDAMTKEYREKTKFIIKNKNFAL